MKRHIGKIVAIALLFGSMTTSAYAAMPQGWFKTGSAPADYDMGSQAGSRHAGDKNGFIRAKRDSSGFGTMMQTVDAHTYHGQRLRLSGWLKTTGANKAGMWMRIDGSDKKVVGFDNMDDRSLHGDNDWKRYDIVLDIPGDAVDIAFGFLLSGKGELLADDFKLEPVDKNVAVTGGALPASLPEAPVNLDFSN